MVVKLWKASQGHALKPPADPVQGERSSPLVLDRSTKTGDAMLSSWCKSITAEGGMRLRLLSIDPDTGGDHCPAVFVDDDTGDIIVQGDIVTSRDELDLINSHSRMAPTEAAVRLPARMADRILEALDDKGSSVHPTDR